jgi:hypothetical protein
LREEFSPEGFVPTSRPVREDLRGRKRTMPFHGVRQEHAGAQMELALRSVHRQERHHHDLGVEPSKGDQEARQRFLGLRPDSQLTYPAPQRYGM